jgi:type II secretory ATPase GspE/PulE/Tfp pilus assembly ATPase PilB-like protein
MNDRDLKIFQQTIGRPHGMVLLTGPTGSGKSTTLYAAIDEVLRSRGGNVITVEDPIEYEMPEVSQVEIDSADKVSFAKALRSILRHDPDVVNGSPRVQHAAY